MSDTRRIPFLHGGSLSLDYDANLFDLTEPERMLIGAITDALEEYCERMAAIQSRENPQERQPAESSQGQRRCIYCGHSKRMLDTWIECNGSPDMRHKFPELAESLQLCAYCGVSIPMSGILCHLSPTGKHQTAAAAQSRENPRERQPAESSQGQARCRKCGIFITEWKPCRIVGQPHEFITELAGTDSKEAPDDTADVREQN